MRIIGFDEQRKLIVEILKKYSDYCEKNNYNYTLAYGTLLGALRHKDLIPWDNDIDVFMPRDDYNRFISEYDSNPIPSIELCCVEKDGNYPFLFAKLSLCGTVSVIEDTTFSFGVYIDIFPLDGMGNDYDTAVKIRSRQIKYIDNGYSPTKNKLLSRVWDKYCTMRCIGYEKYWYIKKYCTENYHNSDYVANIAGWEKGIFRKNDIFGNRTEWFVDRYYRIPVNAELVLSSSYGDYLMLPPMEKRIPPHEYDFYWK